MFLKKKYKLIRKCESDFWGISYFRPRPTKFFIHLKKLFICYLRNSKRFYKKTQKTFFFKSFYKNEYYIRSSKNNLALKDRNVNYYLLIIIFYLVVEV